MKHNLPYFLWLNHIIYRGGFDENVFRHQKLNQLDAEQYYFLLHKQKIFSDFLPGIFSQILFSQNFLFVIPFVSPFVFPT